MDSNIGVISFGQMGSELEAYLKLPYLPFWNNKDFNLWKEFYLQKWNIECWKLEKSFEINDLE